MDIFLTIIEVLKPVLRLTLGLLVFIQILSWAYDALRWFAEKQNEGMGKSIPSPKRKEKNKI